jgi:hypothetical protein
VVLIFKLAVAAPVLPGVTELGEAEQVASAGMPLHEIATAVLYPDTAVTDTVTLVVLPATTVAEVGFTVTPKSDPPPVNVTTWGLLGAASVTVKAPERVPTTEGAKLTLIVQEAPAARLAGQLFDWVKSPEGIILVILKLAVPLLVKVIGWAALVAPSGWLAKVSVVGVRLTTGPPCPVPSRARVWVLPEVPPLLSVTVSVP